MEEMDKASVLLGGLCVGQVFISIVLLTIYGKMKDNGERLNKMLLVLQELADRLWEARKAK